MAEVLATNQMPHSIGCNEYKTSISNGLEVLSTSLIALSLTVSNPGYKKYKMKPAQITAKITNAVSPACPLLSNIIF